MKTKALLFLISQARENINLSTKEIDDLNAKIKLLKLDIENKGNLKLIESLTYRLGYWTSLKKSSENFLYMVDMDDKEFTVFNQEQKNITINNKKLEKDLEDYYS